MIRRLNSRSTLEQRSSRAPHCDASGGYASHREIYSFHERSIQRGGMRNFCVRVASHRRVPASRKSLHSLDAEFPEGSLPDQRQSDGIFDKAIFWFVHSAAMGVWSSDYGIARAIVDRKINNPLSRKASQSETEEFSRPNSVVKSISPALCRRVSPRSLILWVWRKRTRQSRRGRVITLMTIGNFICYICNERELNEIFCNNT